MLTRISIMTTNSPSLSMPRREFFKTGAGFAALAAAGPLGSRTQ
jgi:hypothetical protein